MTKQHAAAATATPPPADDGSDAHLSPIRDGFATLARAFIEAFNDRDADALVALTHPCIVLRPSALAGRRRVYHGHDGLRRWVTALTAMRADFELHAREIRPLPPSGFLVLSTVLRGDELITDAAMIATVDQGRITEAHGYLSDEETLTRLGLIPPAPQLPL